MRSLTYILPLILTAGLSGQQKYVISTVAGAGKLPIPGEGISALQTRLVQPVAMASDGSGTVFILDSYFQSVLKVTPDGAVTRFAGSGEDGFSGDGSPAVEARFRSPAGIFATGGGELYIADAANTRVRKVDVEGNISTYAGVGGLGRSGDGGPALSAGIGNPSGFAMDSQGNLYFSDTFNHVVRRVAADTGVITTVAGSGQLGFAGDNGLATQARLQRPLGIAVDGFGNLFIADSANHRIRRVDANTSVITTIAGTSQAGFNGDNGPAVNALLNNPNDVEVDHDGTIYICDGANGRIRRIRAGTITTVAGGGATTSTDPVQATRAALGGLTGLVFDGVGHIITAETANKRLRSLNLESGELRLFAGTPWVESLGDGLDALSATLMSPTGVAVDANGVVYIADLLDHRIRSIDSAGAVRTFAGIGEPGNGGDGEAATMASISQPNAVAIDSQGWVYVTSPSRIRRIQPLAEGGGISTYAGSGTAGFAGDEGPAVSARVNFPAGLAFDSADNLYFADTSNHRVRKIIRETGVIVTVAGNGIAGFEGDNGPAIRASLSSPRGVAVDAEGNLYIADSLNHRVRKVDSGGIITTIAGNGVAAIGPDNVAAAESRLNTPVGIALDLEGNLLVTHGGHGQIRRISRDSGIITTIAGTAVLGYSGDGSPATDAQMNYPHQLAVLPDGRILVADRLNYRVRVLTPEQ